MRRSTAFSWLFSLFVFALCFALMMQGGTGSAIAWQSATPLASPVAELATTEASPALATPVAAPSVTPQPVAVLPTAEELGLTFPAGITATPLAAAMVERFPDGATSIRLERLTIQPGKALPARTPSAPEVLFGELGTATIIDAFGLSAPLATGGNAALTAGSAYTLRNESTG